MKDTFKFPFAHPEHTKNSTLLQIIVVIGSGILSSSALATVVKAWLDNRKTKLTIQIEGNKKTVEYEGHHLNQDTATIQSVLDVLSKNTTVATAVDVVTINLTNDGQKGAYMLTAGDHQEDTTRDGSEQIATRQQPSLLKRLLPGWLHKEPSSIGTEQTA
jgi:hypothetical protein